MFLPTVNPDSFSRYRWAGIGLSLLSATALCISVSILIDCMLEQSLVDQLMKELPASARDSAEMLAFDLRWQFRLTILVVLNVIATGYALYILWRAFHASQRSLREVTARASDVLQGMEQGVITTDLQGVVTGINQRGLELLNVESRWIGKSLSDFPELPLQAYRVQWMTTRPSDWVGEFALHHAGNERKLRVFCQLLNDHHGNEVGNVLQIRDDTNRILMEERMRRMERYMGLGPLAAGLHHEIKNPLAALSLHVQLLEEQFEAESTSQENRQLLGVIGTEVGRIGSVLESFRDFASLDDLKMQTVNLVDLLQETMDLIRPQAESQGVQIELDLTRQSTYAFGEPVRLKQVFLNLTVNAMEAIQQSGTVRISVLHEDNLVRVRLTDSGCGIPETLKDKILDPYFTTKEKGSGLGLALCDKIVRQHMGTLEYRSTPEGTEFDVILPEGAPAHGAEPADFDQDVVKSMAS